MRPATPSGISGGLNLVSKRPLDPQIGDAYWDVMTHCMQVWNGTQWLLLLQNTMAFEETIEQDVFPSLQDYVIKEEP